MNGPSLSGPSVSYDIMHDDAVRTHDLHEGHGSNPASVGSTESQKLAIYTSTWLCHSKVRDEDASV